jgi:valyl-tRNA synthetase
VIRVAKAEQTKLFDEYRSYFNKLAKVIDLETGEGITKPKASIAAVVRNIEIYLPLSGLVDLAQETAKLEKQVEKLEKELSSIVNKLNNENFIQHAKPEVIEKEQEKQAEVKTKLDLTKEILKDLL